MVEILYSVSNLKYRIGQCSKIRTYNYLDIPKGIVPLGIDLSIHRLIQRFVHKFVLSSVLSLRFFFVKLFKILIIALAGAFGINYLGTNLPRGNNPGNIQANIIRPNIIFSLDLA